jgi:glycosyltransferase involved in cell wall biosynthesis
VGTPVIATNVGGNPELVIHDQNGMLISYGNIDELIEQIEHVLHEPALQHRLIRGGQHTMQQFSWERLFQQTTDVLCRH